MAVQTILEVASATSNEQGTEINLDGDSLNLDIQADSYGTNGKIVVKAKANVPGAVFKTLDDPATVSGLAEYAANTIKYIDRLKAGMILRVDLEISSGTAINVKVVKI